MTFVTDGIGDIGRDEFPGIAIVMAGRICFFDDSRYLMVFGLIASLLSFLFGNGLGNSRQRRFLLEVEVFVIFRMVGILDGQGDIGIGIIREPVVVGIFKGREDGVGIGADCGQAFLAVPFMIGAGNGSAVSVVGDDDDQRVVPVFFIPFLSIFDGLIELDGIIRCALPIHGMELLVDGSAFNHGKEAFRVLAEDVQGFLGHVDEVRLIRIFTEDFRVLEHFPIDINVHRPRMEQAQERFVVRCGHHFFRIGDEGIAFILKFLDDVLVVVALRALFGLRDITARAAAHDDVRAMIIFEIFRSDVVLVGTAARMTDHGSRRSVCRFSLGDDTDGHAAAAFYDFRNIFDTRIIEGIFRGICIDPQGIDDGFMACRISRRRVGAVCRQGIVTAGRNQAVMGHLFHSQQVIVLAVGHAFGNDAGHFAGLQGHAVADEEDDVLGLALGFFLDDGIAGIGGVSAVSIGGRRLYRIGTGFREIDLIGTI